MIVAKKSYDSAGYSIYDNYAYDFEKDNNYIYEKKNANKRNIQNQKYKRKVKNQLKLIAVVLLMFCVGVMVIGRYALVMSLSNQCVSLKKEIAANQKENDNLKVQLLGYYDIKQIEKEATTELSMVPPTNYNIVRLSVGQEITDDKKEKFSDQSKDAGILSEFISLFDF